MNGIWKRHVSGIDNVGTCTFAFRDVLFQRTAIPFFLSCSALGQNWYVTSVIPRHAWVGNSTSRIWGTDKRSKLRVSFCTKRFRKAILLSPMRLTNGVPLATVCIAARLHPRFRAHIVAILRVEVACFLRTIVHRCYTDGRCVEMKRQKMICCGRVRLNVDL